MKRNVEILKSINDEIMDLEMDEINKVLEILHKTSETDSKDRAKRLSKYLSLTLPIGVSEDLMLSIIE